MPILVVAAPTSWMERLDLRIIEFVAKQTPTEDVLQRRQLLRNALSEFLLHGTSDGVSSPIPAWNQPTLSTFGLVEYDLSIADSSDMDISIHLRRQVKTLREAQELLQSCVIPLAAIPGLEIIVDKCHLRHPLIVLKMHGIYVNFSISSSCRGELATTRLMAAYSVYDPRLKQLLLIIKQWTLDRKLGSAKDGYLCGFGWNLLVVLFLQVGCHPRVLPCAQLAAPSCTNLANTEDTDFNDQDPAVRYWVSTNEELLGNSERLTNTKTTAELLCAFLAWLDARDWDKECYSVRLGRIVSSESYKSPKRGFWSEYPSFIFIEDPFDTHNNVAHSVCLQGRLNIQIGVAQAMKEQTPESTLKTGDTLAALFSSGKYMAEPIVRPKNKGCAPCRYKDKCTKVKCLYIHPNGFCVHNVPWSGGQCKFRVAYLRNRASSTWSTA